MTRRAARAAVALVFALAGVSAACGTILGLETLPIVDPDATPDQVSDAAVSDAGCEASSTMCGCVPHDFCDDFDVDGEALGARWSGLLGLTNPFTKGDAKIELTTQALSAPRAILTTAGDPKASSIALLSQQLDHAVAHPGRAFAGFRYALDLQLETLETTEVRGPLVDSGSAVAASVLHFDGPAAKGVAIILSTDGVFLLTAASILDIQSEDSGDGAITQLFSGDILALSRNWLRVEIVMADRDRAVREGFTSCGSRTGGPVVAAAIGAARIKQACLTVPAAVGLSWATQPVVNAGSLLFAGGKLVLRQDNVAFDFLVP
ncbi:hypothetical protein BH11MYX4_BH11MYX4_63340 [soil metagenome]